MKLQKQRVANAVEMEDRRASQPQPSNTKRDSLSDEYLISEPEIVIREPDGADSSSDMDAEAPPVLEPEQEEQDHLMADPQLPAAQESLPKKRPWYVRLCVCFDRYQCVALLHWLMTIAILVLFFTAIALDSWRIFLVNREALLLLRNEGKIDAALLNTTITMTRSHGIYTECFIDDPVKLFNETESFGKTGCRSILTGIKATSDKNHYAIWSEMVVLMSLGPVVVLNAIISLSLLAAAYVSEKHFLFFLLNTILRFINTLMAVAFFCTAVNINSNFNEKDPGFPTSWPLVVRQLTDVRVFMVGPIEWLTAFVLQLIAALFDFWFAMRTK